MRSSLGVPQRWRRCSEGLDYVVSQSGSSLPSRIPWFFGFTRVQGHGGEDCLLDPRSVAEGKHTDGSWQLLMLGEALRASDRNERRLMH